VSRTYLIDVIISQKNWYEKKNKTFGVSRTYLIDVDVRERWLIFSFLAVYIMRFCHASSVYIQRWLRQFCGSDSFVIDSDHRGKHFVSCCSKRVVKSQILVTVYGKRKQRLCDALLCQGSLCVDPCSCIYLEATACSENYLTRLRCIG
jgi:hypothetical protein